MSFVFIGRKTIAKPSQQQGSPLTELFAAIAAIRWRSASKNFCRLSDPACRRDLPAT
jgi:hypothetical protein